MNKNIMRRVLFLVCVAASDRAAWRGVTKRKRDENKMRFLLSLCQNTVMTDTGRRHGVLATI